MATDQRAELAGIRRFDQLVAYLRDRLDWPIGAADFEDLTFEYTPEELGIDAKNAAAIETIRRLRPLAPNQPWGIFFVKFEPKRLPVVALRRILSKVALKKRASANSSERQAWAADDLLFVSNYGEGDQRQITFAHFSSPHGGQDLPTLKVLGWDNLDTALHLDAVAKELTEHLSWPDDESNTDAWRARWAAAFTLGHHETIRTSRDLSIRLADLARTIRDRTQSALAIETEQGPLTKLMAAFRQALVHDLDAGEFADMYAQTIAYGLLSARITDPQKKTADDFAGHLRTNPFLRELMETFLRVGGRRGSAGGPGIDFDELGVSEVVELLDNANMAAVVADFGDRNPQEDPVIHFYELFLKEYDAKKRMRRGVFYTPRPVVSYIVRSVDDLLRSEYGLQDGLADITTWGQMAKRNEGLAVPDGVAPDRDFVQILDPACGTGTFLVEAIDLIHRTLVAKWSAAGHSATEVNALWNEYVPKHLLTRLHGYELLMAPYAIAHLKVGLKLYETGYRFDSDERAHIYLTNALEPAQDFSGRLEFAIPALAHEAQAVNQVKRHRLFTIVMGNPPYSDTSQNLGPQFQSLIEPFRYYRGERIRERGAIRFEHAINNDYVKFWGLGLHTLSSSPVAAVCLITSSSYLAGRSFRGVRDTMRAACDLVQVTDLHGEGWSGELARQGIEDQNVFEIQTGVAICLLAKLPSLRKGHEALVEYAELRGRAEAKVTTLMRRPSEVAFAAVPDVVESYGSFLPSTGEIHPEYWRFPQLDSLFVLSVDGIKTSRDGLVIGNTRAECLEKIISFASSRETKEQLQERLSFECNRMDLLTAMSRTAETFDPRKAVPIAYRPFDVRYIYYDDTLILSHRMNTMPRILYPGAESIVCASRLSSKGFEHALASRTLCSNKYASHDINSRMFFVTFGDTSDGRTEIASGIKSEVLRLAGVPTGIPEPERALLLGHYLLAVLNADSYKHRYHEEISQDFPRTPLPKSRDLLLNLAEVGGRLADAFCLALDVPEDKYVFHGSEGEEFTSPLLVDGGLRVGRNSIVGGVDASLWEMRVAGYQVCKSWGTAGGRSGLAREGTKLDAQTIGELRRILYCAAEVARLRTAADEVIEAHGGWPGAFQAGDTRPAGAEVIPFRPRTVQPSQADRYAACVPLVSLKIAAGAFGDPQHIEEDDFEWVALESAHRLRPGMFVAQVVGKSMEPAIPDGSYCLFSAPVAGSRLGKTVLVQLRDGVDPETGERYTVKRFDSQKDWEMEGLWQHRTITLRPDNPDFQPIVLTSAQEGDVKVIAELVEVLHGDA
jgi:SOS-response transcriptional repressor LexA